MATHKVRTPGKIVAAILVVVLASYAAVGAWAQPTSDPDNPRVAALLRADSEGEAKAALEALGCSPWLLPSLARRSQLAIFLLLVLVVMAVAIGLGPLLEKRKLQLDVGNLILAVGLLVAASQWQASIEQQAMEKYEHEVASLNEAEGHDESETIHTMMAHLYRNLPGETEPNYDNIHYVYIQLDNLEYALERYTQGLSSAYTTVRAVKTFQSRCKSPEFRTRVKYQLSDSYPQVVGRVVNGLDCICTDCFHPSPSPNEIPAMTPLKPK
jgi:hypothetical protein